MSQMSLRLESLREQFDDGTYPERFWRWLAQNEHVLTAFCQLARRMKRRGVQHWSAKAIFEVLRYQTAVRERGQSKLKLNNSATAWLARLAMRLCPDLQGFFELRSPPARAQARKWTGEVYGEARS